ncbi:MAG TPA: type II secretion system secretin GspD [Desulfobacterales bacterium]
MIRRHNQSIRIALVVLVLMSLAVSALAQKAGTPKVGDRFVTIDFNNVDINVFIKFISELTGRNFIVDQRVRGNVTIISPTKISVDEAYRVFESVLEVHGFTTVQAGKVTKILPSPEARTQNIETYLESRRLPPEDRLVTQLIPLTYADPDEIKRLFTPLVSKSSVIVSYAPTNMLIVTDMQSNIQRLLRIIDEIDVAGIGQEITVLPLAHADSNKLVSLLSSIFQAGPPKKGGTDKLLKFVADERTNSLIILASEIDTMRIRSLVDMLDRETPRGKEKIRVYFLEYADAEELAKVLQQVPSKEAAGAQPKGQAPIVSGNVQITADKATNSLVITASSEDYQVLEEIIRQLDIPRPMVYIEALFMEVDVNKDFRLGTEWLAAGETEISGRDTFFGGGFRQSEGSNLIGLATDPPVFPGGMSLGVFTEAITIAGVEFSNLAAVVQAFKEDREVNILQTPQILTTENQEAKINVSTNIPFQTRTSTSENETFNSFEYRDVGTILSITPHITRERLVRLTLALEVSAVEDTTDFRPTTLRRTVDTTVIVRDNDTVVIGGLIEDQTASSEFKVPLLGDIPVLGWLFKVRSEASRKTNLYVFLTPRVIKNPEEAERIYGSKRTQMDTFREGQIKLFDPQAAEEPKQVD